MFFGFDYPSFFPDFRFISAVLFVYIVCFYINTRNIPEKYKYISTYIWQIILFLVPIPFFIENWRFGSLILAPINNYGYLPFLLLLLIVINLKFYSLQVETIKGKKEIPTYTFVLYYPFLVAYYYYDPDKLKKRRTADSDMQNLIITISLILKYFIYWFLLILIFYYLPVPIHPFTACIRGYWIPVIIGSGVVTLLMFALLSTILSFSAQFVNLFYRYDIELYSNKPFQSTSIAEFWRNWNLWTADWFFHYLYRPLRKKWRLKHYQAIFCIFTFSAILHTYCIMLINMPLAWLAFFSFFINGIAVIVEEAAVKKYPILSKIPTPIKYIFTMTFIGITMGLFGISFTKI